MADVVINTVVKAPDTNALTAIKKELKEMKALALNGDGVAAKRVAELTDKLEDLKDTTKSLKGDGVERLQSSFGLLGESLRTGDLDKAKIAFKGIGSAMAAIPLLLLIEGLKVLFDNLDSVVAAFKTFFSAFSEGEQNIKKYNKELEKQKEINKGLIAGLEDEIKILEAQGASNAKIIAKKKELNALKIKELEIDARIQLSRLKEIQDNDSLIESYYRKSAALLRSLGQDQEAAKIDKLIAKEKIDRSKEAVDKFKEDLANIQHLKTEDRVNEIKEEKEHGKKLQKVKEDNIQREKDRQAREADVINAQIDKEEKDKKALDERRKKDLEDLKALKLKQDQEESAAFIENERVLTETKRKEADARYNIEKEYIQSARILSDLFFQGQLNAADGDAKRQLEIKKRAFQVDKAFQASQASIDGYRAVLSAYATAPPGFKIASSVAAGIFAAAQVAKILAARFNPGSAPTTPSGGGGGVISSGSSGNPAAQPIPQSKQQSTQFDQNGNKIGEPIIVKVSEINDVQRKVARVEQQSKF